MCRHSTVECYDCMLARVREEVRREVADLEVRFDQTCVQRNEAQNEAAFMTRRATEAERENARFVGTILELERRLRELETDA